MAFLLPFRIPLPLTSTQLPLKIKSRFGEPRGHAAEQPQAVP